jgi:hypothetical protein
MSICCGIIERKGWHVLPDLQLASLVAGRPAGQSMPKTAQLAVSLDAINLPPLSPRSFL